MSDEKFELYYREKSGYLYGKRELKGISICIKLKEFSKLEK